MRFLLFGIFFISCANIYAQVQFGFKNIALIYNKLPKECVAKIEKRTQEKDTLNCVTINDKKIGLSVHRNKYNEIDHIGINLFTDSLKNEFGFHLCNFIERTLLLYLLQDNISEINRYNKEEKIGIFINDFPPGKGKFNDVKQIIPFLGLSNFNINRDSLHYTVKFSENKNVFLMLFPANHSLIRGKDKKELDQELADILCNVQPAKLKYTPPAKSELIIFKDNILLKKGKEFSKHVSSDRFYVMKNKKIQAFADKKYISASFSNMFLVFNPKWQNKAINIRHKIYGNEFKNYALTLGEFLTYAKDFELYFGQEASTVEQLKATLFLYDKELNYLNILEITTSPQDLFDTNKSLNALLFSNIPMDNIENLYKVSENKKQQMNIKIKIK